MGLRSILGLPSRSSRAEQPPAQDVATYTTAKTKYDKLIAEPRLQNIAQSFRDDLAKADVDAKGLSKLGEYDEAASRLNSAITAAVQEIVRQGTAKADYDKVSPKISGLLDGAQLWGVDATYMSALRKRFNDIVASAANDLKAAADSLIKMAGELAKDAKILAAKKARDLVLADKAKVEADAAEALKIATETPEVLKLNRLLANEVPLIGFCAGKNDYLGALAHLEKCRTWTAEIMAQAQAVADNIALRDTVQAKRQAMNDDVKSARLLYGHDKPSKALVEDFQKMDKAFEGAMYNRDYKVASTLLPRFENLTKRVLVLKPSVDADRALATDARKVWDEILPLKNRYWDIPEATKQLKDLGKVFGDLWSLFQKARGKDDNAKIIEMGPELKKAAQAFFEAADAAKEQIDKLTALIAEWTATGAARYATAIALKPRLPELVDVIEQLKKAQKEADKEATANDFDAARKKMDSVFALLDRIDALADADKQAKANRTEAVKAYKKLRKQFDNAQKVKAYSPEMLALFDKFREGHNAMADLISSGSDQALAKIAELGEVVKAIEAAKVENAAQKVAALAEGRKAMTDCKQPYLDALLAANNNLPHSQDLRNQLLALDSAIAKANNAGQPKKVASICPALLDVCRQIMAAVPQWETDKTADKDDYDSRFAAIKTNYDKVAGYSRVSPKIKKALVTAKDRLDETENEYGRGNFGTARENLNKLEQDVAALLGLEAEHDSLKADRSWIRAKRTAIKDDVEEAIDAFALIPETQDIQARMDYAYKQAQKAYSNLDFPAARTLWTELDGLLTDWNSKAADNTAAWTQDAKDVHSRLKVVKPERDTAGNMGGITPELKTLSDAYGTASGRFWRAYSSVDWPLCLELMDAFEKTVKAYAAKKSDYDAALIIATQKSTDASVALTAITDQDLKAKTAIEKLDLLDDLRARGKALTDDERKLQRKVYNALDFDPEFKLADEKRRSDLVDALKADEEIVQARGKWGTMSTDERLAVLVKVLEAECKVYNIPAPKVRLFCEPPGDEGYFAGDSMTLNLNTHPFSDFSDYKEAVNTVVHENMHNYQAILAQRLEEGILVKGEPDYVQAMIFAANDGPYGYVDTDEKPDPGEPDQNPYKTQPLEDHAWKTGDGVAEALLAEDPPERGVKL